MEVPSLGFGQLLVFCALMTVLLEYFDHHDFILCCSSHMISF